MKPKNRLKRLLGRRRDYQATIGAKDHESKVQMRINNGGYHKPGSNNK